jgi:hypothetical protein
MRLRVVQFAAALSLVSISDALAQSAGGITLGESRGGVTDRAYVNAPPDWIYVVEREAGSFLDCGDGADVGMTDSSGRGLAALDCGVTLTETVVIPAASASARIVIHH